MMESFFVGLLNVPKGAVVGLDGQTILLRSDDFVGIQGTLERDEGAWHLVTLQSHVDAVTRTAFWIGGRNQLAVVRRYDVHTEELVPVDTVTVQNLLQQIPQLAPGRVLQYQHVVTPEHQEQWKKQTQYIIPSGILSHRHLGMGDKILPGCYQDDRDEMDAIVIPPSEASQSAHSSVADGKSVQYPSIPVMDRCYLASIRTHKHAGTQHYLRQLDPFQRTSLFRRDELPEFLLEDVMQRYYHNDVHLVMGDLQLSYILFLHVQCFSSLEHWKDWIALLSLLQPPPTAGATIASTSVVERSSSLLSSVLKTILPPQLESLDADLFMDPSCMATDGAGDLPSSSSLRDCLQRLCAIARTFESGHHQALPKLVQSKFPDYKIPQYHFLTEQQQQQQREPGKEVQEDDEDEDGPVVVGMEEYQSSMARAADAATTTSTAAREAAAAAAQIAGSFPFLVAARQPQEDIVMTCARVLDEKVDVSLVREAAAYLETVEATATYETTSK